MMSAALLFLSPLFQLFPKLLAYFTTLWEQPGLPVYFQNSGSLALRSKPLRQHGLTKSCQKPRWAAAIIGSGLAPAATPEPANELSHKLLCCDVRRSGKPTQRFYRIAPASVSQAATRKPTPHERLPRSP